jgi:hypothetical protein
MPTVGFKPTIPASERPQTHALDRAATGIGTTYYCLFLERQPPEGLLIHKDSRSHTTTYHIQQDSSGRVISSSQRPLPDYTHNTHKRHTSMPPVGFEPTISAGERTAADLRLRPRGHWDRPRFSIIRYNFHCTLTHSVPLNKVSRTEAFVLLC